MFKQLIKEILHLKNMKKMFEVWDMDASDWFIGYGFFLKPYLRNFYNNEDHFHVVINVEKLPWKVKEKGQIIPPQGSKYMELYLNFIKSNFELILDGLATNDFQERFKITEKIFLDKNEFIYQISPHEYLKLLLRINLDPTKYYDLLDKTRSYINKTKDKEMAIIIKELELKRKDKIIKGVAANSENVQGEVKMILPNTDLSEIKIYDYKDKILVIEDVMPRNIPLIKDVLGIITLEGNVLAHSAIIAREFNKPCFVGVESVFYDLRDGDMVELNGKEGYVKIIK